MLASELKARLNKTKEFLESELTQIRTGRVSPSIVESVAVEVYGSKMTIKELAAISLLDSQTLLISPWDKSTVNDIAKSLREGDLKLSPVVDGDVVRVSVPPLTEERRKDLSKVVSGKVEDAKQAFRNIRQEAMKEIEEDFKNKLFGEDEKFVLKDEVEKIVRDFVSEAETLGESKKKDLMTL